jgi:hypothetical protein
MSANDEHQGAEVWTPARDCLHEGTCSSPDEWLCCHQDALNFRPGYEARQWRCHCGPCHETEAGRVDLIDTNPIQFIRDNADLDSREIAERYKALLDEIPDEGAEA